METFFNPASVVVIGASNSPFNLGATICRTIKHFAHFPGPVYAVNRKSETVFDCPGYATVTDIPGPVDLAVIIAPAAVAPDFIAQCAAKGIRHVVIESSGFSEGGPKGRTLQRAIDTIAQAHGMRILGPNCLGVLNTRNRFCCFYGIFEILLTSGDVDGLLAVPSLWHPVMIEVITELFKQCHGHGRRRGRDPPLDNGHDERISSVSAREKDRKDRGLCGNPPHRGLKKRDEEYPICKVQYGGSDPAR